MNPGDAVHRIRNPGEILLVLGPAYPQAHLGKHPHLTRYQISCVICLKPNGTTVWHSRSNLKLIEAHQ